ncbi:related to rRNA processing protein [Ramularia collo-cygni]|uniref:Ribosomal RNA-processing protein 42 n=1 Tax=Ramularia collo-cygni TaxID=112498 RepID=A0A2D3VFN9_9PEZI|nr:related to rRNA processing protein [Ramularia collo-cygni]CZT24725.1 related to rRNA processing protein [Ramularia collo-cygni]
MAPYTNIPLSPAELSYLHNSLAQDPPIRPDGREPTQFRPLVAETDILPSANGSARICFADGTEAIVGVKAEVEKSRTRRGVAGEGADEGIDVDMGDTNADDGNNASQGQGEHSWLEIAIEIPGIRDDDALPVFLSAMLTEALLADGELKDRLWINSRFHWRLYVDILLLSQPLSYPLPLLSLTTHLALLATRMPALISEKDEDPLFNDDWEASTHLFPRDAKGVATTKPPVTLLVMTVGSNIIFDPSQEELAVADAVVAISAAQDKSGSLRMVALRTVDPPSRLTAAGVPNNSTSTTGLSAADVLELREKDAGMTVWRPPRGGMGRTQISQIIKAVVATDGVGSEVMEGLQSVDV